MINDYELLAVFIYLIIRIVEREVFGDYRLQRELGTPIITVRVIRIHFIDGDEVYQYIYRQERWDKSVLMYCTS